MCCKLQAATLCTKIIRIQVSRVDPIYYDIFRPAERVRYMTPRWIGKISTKGGQHLRLVTQFNMGLTPLLLFAMDFGSTCFFSLNLSLVDCKQSMWSLWSDCSRSCDGGTIHRSRNLLCEQTCSCLNANLDEDRSCNIEWCPGKTFMNISWSILC